MSRSPVAAVSRAFERMQRTLFPIQADKWIHLGFIAFLAGLGEGGAGAGGGGFNVPGPWSMPGGTSPVPDVDRLVAEAERFVRDNLVMIVTWGSLVLAIGLGLWVLLTWLSSRGKFMFVESVIHDRWAVSEPWGRLRTPAWQLFKARLLLGGLGLLLTLGWLGSTALLAWPALAARRFDEAILWVLVVTAVLLLLSFPLLVFLSVLDDFIVPLMYLDGRSVWQAWREFQQRLLPSNVGVLTVFYLLKLLLGMAGAMVAMVAMCLTCCLAALPFVSSVVLLPVHAFFRAYSLYMLEELGRPVFPAPVPNDGFPGYERFPSAGSG